MFGSIKFIFGHPMCSDRRLCSVLRYLRWQLAQRILPKPVIHTWINETRIILAKGETGLTGNFYCGLHEYQDMAFILHAVDETDRFLDVGANVGSYTLLACGVKGAAGIAFEPVPSTYKRLRDNLSLNGLQDSVNALNLGVGAKRETLKFTNSENCTNHALSNDEGARSDVVEVNVVTLDDEVREFRPTVMKIDVEGFETNVLQGGVAVFEEPSLNVVLIEHNESGRRYGFSDQDICEKMEHWGFSAYVYQPAERKLMPCHAGKNNTGNTLFVRSVEVLADKLANRATFKINGVTLSTFP